MRYLRWILLKLRLYQFVFFPARSRLAKKYISGNGIEIGALHLPLAVPLKANVKYVDRLPSAQLRTTYPELASFQFTPVDIVDDGEKLDSIPLSSQDFIIANHLIEHCENPIATITNYIRRLKPGGILFIAIPDKNKTFDRERQVTTLDHVIQDYRNGPEWSRLKHYCEWARHISHVPEDEVQNHARSLMDFNYSIHFHAWQLADFHKLVEYVKDELKAGFTIQETSYGRNEFIFILKKN